MKLNKHVIALATSTALIGAGLAVPTSNAQDNVQPFAAITAASASSAAVEGFTWPEKDITAGGEAKVTPSKAAPDADTYRFVGPADGLGYTFTTNEKTGEVTVKAPLNAEPGGGVKFTIQVYKLNAEAKKYEKAGEYETSVNVVKGGDNQATNYAVSYDPLTVKEGESKVAANKAKTLPKGTMFSVVFAPEQFNVSVNNQGHVTVTPGSKVGAGSTATARIKVTYPDTSVAYTDLKITVSDKDGNTTPHTERDTAKYSPTWPDTTELDGNAGAAKTATRSGDVPAGTTFKLREDLLSNLGDYVNIEVAANGNVTVSPKTPVKAGFAFNVPVEVTYPDASHTTKAVPFKVTKDGQWQSQQAKVTYPDITTPADKAGTSTPTGQWPEGTKFASHSKLPDGWTFNVNETTGEATIKAAPSSSAGLSGTAFVLATFPDGTNNAYPVKFTTAEPSKKLADAHEVSYPATTVTAGKSTKIAPKITPAAPAGTKFFGPNQDKDGLKISTNEATGEVSISVAAGTSAGAADIPVTVRYTDGTSKKVSFKLTIEPAATTKPTDPTKPSEPSEPTPPTPEPTPPTPEPTPPTSPSERPSQDGSSGSSENNVGLIVGILVTILVAIGGAIAALPMLQNFRF